MSAARAHHELKTISMGAPAITEEDIERVAEVLRSGQLREGPVCRAFEEAFAAKVGSRYALAVSSGTAALHIAYLALVAPGDEVLVPAFTFIATASMVAFCGATPVFCDVDPRTFTLDPEDARRRITPRTRALAPVHLFGNSCAIEALRELADTHKLRIIWDAAQAHGTRYRGADVGSFADVVCYSFYPSKNMTTGEGGMIVTSDADIYEKCKRLRNHGQAEKYLHIALGLNYRMTEMQAALGASQLARLNEFVRRRRANAAFLTAHLKETAAVVVPYGRPDTEHSFNQYSILLAAEGMPARREAFCQFLRTNRIETAVHYPRPVHWQPVFAARERVSLPVSEDLAQRIVSLPVHPQLTTEDLERIAQAVAEASKQVQGAG